MIKKISAIKARQNLGQIMNEVSLRGEDYIIERAGKPLVAVIPIEKYKQIQEEKKEFFDWVDEVRAKTKGIKLKDVEKAIGEAVAAVKKTRKNRRHA